jgi:hypothetical protein
MNIIITCTILCFIYHSLDCSCTIKKGAGIQPRLLQTVGFGHVCSHLRYISCTYKELHITHEELHITHKALFITQTLSYILPTMSYCTSQLTQLKAHPHWATFDPPWAPVNLIRSELPYLLSINQTELGDISSTDATSLSHWAISHPL